MTVYCVWDMNYGWSQGTFESADDAPELADLTLGLELLPMEIEEREYPIDPADPFGDATVVVEWVLLVDDREAYWIAKESGQTIRKVEPHYEMGELAPWPA